MCLHRSPVMSLHCRAACSAITAVSITVEHARGSPRFPPTVALSIVFLQVTLATEHEKIAHALMADCLVMCVMDLRATQDRLRAPLTLPPGADQSDRSYRRPLRTPQVLLIGSAPACRLDTQGGE